MKEASAIDASTQAQAPLMPERRTKSTLKDRQAVPHPGVGDEVEAGAKNNQGVGKQKGTNSEAVRSPKPRVQPIAKNKVGAEIQNETAGSFEDPPMEKNRAKKKPGFEKEKIPSLIKLSRILLEEDHVAELAKPKVDGTGNEKAKQQQAKRAKGRGSLVKPTEKVQVPQEVKKPKCKDTSAAPNLIKASEQPVKRKLPLQAATLGSPSKHAKVKSSGPLKFADSLLPPQPYVELYIDGKLMRMCGADPACPTRVGERVGGVLLNLVPKSLIGDKIRTQECFQEVDWKYEVNCKAVERRAIIRALECWDYINKRHVRCNKDDFVQNFVASRMRKADAMQELQKDAIIKKIQQGYERHWRVQVGYVSSEDEDTAKDSSNQLEEYEKQGPAKLTVKVKKEERESDLVKIYDSSDEEEAKQDQEEAEHEGGEEKSEKEEEKSICEEGEEEEDEGGDEEGADDEEEGGDKPEEEGREGDKDYQDGSDGEKTDEGDGSTGDDEDSKDDGEGSGDDGKGGEEGDCAKSTDGSDEGDRIGAKVEEAKASSDKESTPEPSGGGGTPEGAVALASMKGSCTLGLCFTSMDTLLYVS
ncbi:hypothetical protein L7F22_049939 [Adiantum nelumboides]|nr:hypothetical protein [Adiantum nelumboides]